MNTFTVLFLVMLSMSICLQVWLALRHARHVRAHRDEVPLEFRDRIPQAAHRKAADYTVANTKLGVVETVYGALLLLGWTIFGGLELLDGAWRGAGWGPLATGIAVLLSAVLLMSVLDLPFSAYRTFVIEQRFGFNRSTVGVFVVDLLKGALLLVLIGGPLAALVLWIMGAAGALWWLYVWIVWFSFSLLMMWAYPSIIAPLFNKFSPLQDVQLCRRIEALLQECGFKSDGIFVMDGSRRSTHGNAYFGGLGNNKRIVFFDNLIKQLNGDEIEAVLAHELGHYRLHHIRKRLFGLGVISFLGLALLGWLAQQPWFYQGLGVTQTSLYMALLLFLLCAPVFGFLLTPAGAWLSRRHEFQADAFAASKRNAPDLIRALVKLYEENASTLTPDPLYSRFYYSHPPASVRIAHLNATTGSGSPA